LQAGREDDQDRGKPRAGPPLAMDEVPTEKVSAAIGRRAGARRPDSGYQLVRQFLALRSWTRIFRLEAAQGDRRSLFDSRPGYVLFRCYGSGVFSGGQVAGSCCALENHVPHRSGSSPAPLQIPSLDGIRGLSVLLVFGSHVLYWLPIPGRFGVTVFFFLSGYLITTLLRIERARDGTISFKDFYIRRTLRIIPPFALIFLGTVILVKVGLFRGTIDHRGLIAGFAYYANYAMISGIEMPPGTGVVWSLAVEEHFYLAFPVIYFLLSGWLRNGVRLAALLWAMCACVLAWRLFLVFHLRVPLERTLFATDTRIDGILFGCALAVWGNPIVDGRGRFSERAWKWLLFPSGLLVLLASLSVSSHAIRESVRYTIQGVALVPVFVTAIRFPRWGPMRVLNWRPLAFLGTISYSFYLLHDVVYEQVMQRVSQEPLRVALTLAISIAASWAIYRLVERPVARLRARLLGARGVRAIRGPIEAAAPGMMP